MSGNHRVFTQCRFRIEPAAQFHLVIQFVDAAVASPAQHQALAKLIACVLFCKAASLVQLPGNEVMKSQRGFTLTQGAMILLAIAAH